VTGGWRRIGRLSFDTSGAQWATTHAALPALEPLDEGLWRIYLSLRDPQGRARIGCTRLTMTPVPALAPLDPEPVLDLGVLGAFDDSGVTSSCVVTDGPRRLLYYTGWSLGVTVPFYLASGIAVSEHGSPFRRLSHAPLLDRCADDPFLNASPFVRRENGRWRMWYVAATAWTQTADGPRHSYNIRYAESADGINWRRTSGVCIDYGSSDEYAIARPWVLHEGGVYRMWFSVRGERYRVGYAESEDGLAWTRDDAAGGLRPSGEGWDSEMVAYAAVFDWRGTLFMLYNGNEYGKTGVGLARWEPS
jgi:hypothetical protein